MPKMSMSEWMDTVEKIGEAKSSLRNIVEGEGDVEREAKRALDAVEDASNNLSP